MDPNQALKELRELVAQLNDGEIPTLHAASEIADRFEALDEWLSKGGFLPDAWSKK